jgi:hypothetical protein
MFGNGKNGLNFLGDDTTLYQTNYTLKSSKQKNPWSELVQVTKILNKTPLSQLEDSLSKYMDVDRTFWMLACENIFLDDDGYVFKGGMDYYLYYEPETGRMVTLQYDGNATMNSENTDWGPFMNEDRENYPLMNRALKVPSLRQRYLAHMRTILNESVNPEKISPIIDKYATLIGTSVKEDPNKLYSEKEFEEGIPDLKEFATKRKSFLMTNEEVNRTGLTIINVQHQAKGTTSSAVVGNAPVSVTVTMNKSDKIRQINLWYSTGLVGRFFKIKMNDPGKSGDTISGDGVYASAIPGFAKGTVVRYYIEAVAGDKPGTATYSPAGAEHDVYTYKVK